MKIFPFRTHAATCLGLGVFLVASTAYAVDGVIEINQTCAVNGGCFAGDSAGYPITIDGSAGQSYRLTSNLIVPTPSTNGIEITTSSISVDLNGFEIVGIGCVGATSNCTPSANTGVGVRVGDISMHFGTSVRNGSITGMGGLATLVGQNSEVHQVRARWNGSGGVGAGAGSVLTGNTALENGGYGLGCGAGCLVRGNAARGNSHGLSLASDAGYRGNVLTGNTLAAVDGGINLGGNACNGSVCP